MCVKFYISGAGLRDLRVSVLTLRAVNTRLCVVVGHLSEHHSSCRAWCRMWIVTAVGLQPPACFLHVVPASTAGVHAAEQFSVPSWSSVDLTSVLLTEFFGTTVGAIYIPCLL